VCTYCGTRLNLNRVKIVSRAETAKKASETVRALKKEKVKKE
jgi:hypothetical protein